MHLLDWFEFLIGSERGIRLAAGSNGLLTIGSILVLTAGMARSWRRKNVAREPWWLVLPFIASAFSCFALTVVFSMSWFGFAELPQAILKVFPVLLTCFWLMAPMAWLYGLPFDRIQKRSKALNYRLFTLLFVSIWRVALTVQIVAVLFDVPSQVSFVNVMLFSAIVALVAIYVAGKSLKRIEGAPFIIGLMGGIETKQIRHYNQLREVAGCLAPIVVIGGIIFWIAWLFSFQAPPKPVPGTIGIIGDAHRSLFLFAIFSLLVWIGFTFVGQRKQARAFEVDQLIQSNQIAEAVLYLSNSNKHDFFGDWSPMQDHLCGIAPLEGLLVFIDESLNQEGWVRGEGQRLAVELVSDPLLYWFDEKQVEEVSNRMPDWNVDPLTAAGTLSLLHHIQFQLQDPRELFGDDEEPVPTPPNVEGLISTWPTMTVARRKLANQLKIFAGDLYDAKAHDLEVNDD